MAQEPVVDSKESDFVPGEILVKFKPGVGVQDSRQRVAEVQGKVVQSIPSIGVLRVKVSPGQETAAIEKLQARSDVEYVELNHLVYAQGTPNDSLFSLQWGMSKINMPAAWDITEGSSDIIIAIVDTGIDLDHPDFSCTVSSGANKLTSGYDFYNNDSNPDDDNNHGTHVAGIAGACTNNTIGVAGAAPNVRLMPVKVLNYAGSGNYSDVASGVIYAADNGAKIINLSLGGSSANSTLENAVNYATNTKGALVIAAAGNCAQGGGTCSGVNPIMYPAAYSGAVAVAATDSNDNWAYYSEYHSYVEVAAPGGLLAKQIRSTIIGNYGDKYGTSMATPHVAGLAALIWTMNSGMTHSEVRQILQSTADDLGAVGKDDYFGYGRVNAQRALELFTSIGLLDTSGQEITPPIYFMVDDHIEFLPSERTIGVTTTNQDIITWTATISPSVSWVSVSPPITGLVSASLSSDFTLVATRPVTYTSPYSSTTLVITGTTSAGLEIGPTTSEVRINYIPELFRYRFPMMFKNATLP